MIHRLRSAMNGLGGAALNLLFPPDVVCLACGRAPRHEMHNGLCEACRDALDALGDKQDRQTKRACPQELAFVHAAYPYEGPAMKLIRALKYEYVKSAAFPLIEAMVLLPSGEEDLIVPVPTTKKRLCKRGFNQSMILAKGIGERLGMTVCDVLKREGEQREQSGLSAKERVENLHGCMRAKKRLDGKKILLVDDVFTTGSTAKEAARALLEAGAVSVGVFAAARSIEESELPEFMRTDS